MRVIKDTLINSKTYKLIKGKYNHVFRFEEWIYRDSSNYLVNSSGKIIMSSINFSDTLSITNPEWATGEFYWYTKMKLKTGNTETPAGIFSYVLNSLLTVVSNDPDVGIIRENDILYAPEVGCILDQYFYISQYEKYKTYSETRLVAYHIEPEIE